MVVNLVAETTKPRSFSKRKVVKLKVVKKKKYNRSRGLSISKLAYRVAQINCEKKENNVYYSSGIVGQFYVGSAGANPTSGHYLSSGFTPQPANGTTDTTRIGDEIKITGMHNIFQFFHMSNTSQSIKCKIMFITPKSGVSGLALTIDKLLNVNPIVYFGNGGQTTVYDITSARNLDYIRDFRILRSKTFIMPGDTASLSQKVVKTVDMGLKFKKPWPIRFDTTGSLSYGQIYCLILTESGNCTANTPSSNTIGIPINDTLSGLNFQFYSKSYFIDA